MISCPYDGCDAPAIRVSIFLKSGHGRHVYHFMCNNGHDFFSRVEDLREAR